MDKKTKVFIEKARKVHGNKFDYRKVEYTKAITKVDIICDNGHTFQQTPNNHLRGSGCLRCSGRYSPTTEEWIESAREVHGSLYDYRKVKYINNKTKVKIICNIHGEFEQAPNNHLSGRGCNKCSNKAQTKTTETFIKEAREVHEDLYDYSLTKYHRWNEEVKIICKVHGKFEQTANNHLMGSGCNKCAQVVKGWSNEYWTRRSEKSQYFNSFKVYIIRCWNEEEEFIKIGKTFTTIERRFSGKIPMPYNYEIIRVIELRTAEEATGKETELHYKFRNKKYSPKIDFNGVFECFTKDILKTLKI